MKKNLNQKNKGFTIIEMLAVLGIFAILTSVVMFRYSEFNSKTIMTNMAYEIALTVRQAQVYSLGVRADVDVTDFDNRYGVYFNTDSDPKVFSFFFDEKADVPDGVPNGWCDPAPDSANCLACLAGGECKEMTTLTRDIFIDKICVSKENNPVDESGGCVGSGSEKDQVSITFDRPNPDAQIKIRSDVDREVGDNVGIVLKNSFGSQRAVIIRSTGQISVQMIADPS